MLVIILVDVECVYRLFKVYQIVVFVARVVSQWLCTVLHLLLREVHGLPCFRVNAHHKHVVWFRGTPLLLIVRLFERTWLQRARAP